MSGGASLVAPAPVVAYAGGGLRSKKVCVEACAGDEPPQVEVGKFLVECVGP